MITTITGSAREIARELRFVRHPRCWDGFDSMGEDARTILNHAYNVWVDAGHAEKIHDPAYNPWLRADHALRSAFERPIN